VNDWTHTPDMHWGRWHGRVCYSNARC